MPGRHASHLPVRRSRWPRRLFVLTIVGTLVAGGYFGRDYLPDSVRNLADRFTGSDDGCTGSIAVDVTASPDIASAVAAVFSEGALAERPNLNGTCIDVSVTPQPSSEVAATIGTQSTLELWIADSSLWLSRITAEGIELGESTSIATSPLVGVASKPVADAVGWPEAEFSWGAMVGGAASGGPAATIVDPTTTSTGFATILAAAVALGAGTESADETQMVQALSAMSQNVTASVDDAFIAVDQAPAEAPVFTAIEQAVAAHNQDSFSPVVALYPAEGTIIFDYPAIPVSLPDTPTSVRDAVQLVIGALSSPEAVEIIQSHGFRSRDGVAAQSVGIGDGLNPAQVQALPALPADASQRLASQWTQLSRDMRMLAVIDVSGSMVETDGGEQTRAELVQGAATNALGFLPATSSVGMWVFSTEEDEENGLDWRELISLGPLTDPIETEAGEVTRLEALAGAAAQIPGIAEANEQSATRGWTGLYDTLDGAFKAIKDGYDPTRENSVVILTDGADQSPPGESSDVSLDDLLALIEGQDPARPITIIAIGIGEQADMEALTRIADASGGFADVALDPADIQDVFFRAMIERHCRPMCG